MSLYTNEVLSKLSTLTLYRLLIKNIKFYPSKKKFDLLLSIKEGNFQKIFLFFLSHLFCNLFIFLKKNSEII